MNSGGGALGGAHPVRPTPPTGSTAPGSTSRTGPRVVLRRFRTADLDAFLEYQARPDVRRFLPGEPMNEVAAAAFVADQSTMPDRARDAWHAFAIEHVATGRVIGDVGVWLSSGDRSSTGDVGFQLDPAWQGRGYAEEAMRLLIPSAFTAFGLDAITATCRRENERSARLLRRLGLQPAGETEDELHFRLERGDRMQDARLRT